MEKHKRAMPDHPQSLLLGFGLGLGFAAILGLVGPFFPVYAALTATLITLFAVGVWFEDWRSLGGGRSVE